MSFLGDVFLTHVLTKSVLSVYLYKHSLGAGGTWWSQPGMRLLGPYGMVEGASVQQQVLTDEDGVERERTKGALVLREERDTGSVLKHG